MKKYYNESKYVAKSCHTDMRTMGYHKKAVILDLEFNPIDPRRKEETNLDREIIEIGAVLVDDKFNTLDSFSTVVKPQYNNKVNERVTKLCHIETKDTKNAPVFMDAMDSFFKWIDMYKEEVCFIEWSDADRCQMSREMGEKNILVDPELQTLFMSWLDLQAVFNNTFCNLSNSVSLNKAMYYAGIDSMGREHEALTDAINTAILYRVLYSSTKSREYTNLQNALGGRSFGTSLGAILGLA